MTEPVITEELIASHGLTVEEYEKICAIMGRKPNYTELGIFSVMWSEHCSYKSSRRYLKTLPTKGECVVQGPGENAGIIDLGNDIVAVFKIESHNHPSFISPYQGAGTGVGGILRDIFTMGARPIANMNSLRFGNVSNPRTRYIIEEVVAGIAGYGNCMGIPTVGGEVFFDDCYENNPLVNAFTLGIAKKDMIFYGKASGIGNPVIYIGSRTGRDGIHGATMASEEFNEESEERRPTVQVGDPFTEKLLLEACLELMEKNIILGIQDMGAAGLTCSTSEMAARANTGIEIDLSLVPLRETGMTPYEIMLSESQERMLLVSEQGKEKEIESVLRKWDLEAAVIGKVTDTGRFVVKNHGEVVSDIPVPALTDDAPLYNRPLMRPSLQDKLQTLDISSIPLPQDIGSVFDLLIASPDLCSRRWVYEQYDHMVETNTVILPGSDAAVLRLEDTGKGIAVSLDGNGRYCHLDPFEGSKIGVAESARNIACSGGRPLAITNCLNFANPERPEVMWQFSEVIRGMTEACNAFGAPVISGNVSFYNETTGNGIYPTPVIGMVGIIDDINCRCTQALKKENDLIILLGENREEIGGSVYLKLVHGLAAGKLPVCDLETEKRLQNAVRDSIGKGLINSAHDCSDGGLAVTLAEMCMSASTLLGVDVEIDDDIRVDALLFGETQSRVVVACPKEKEEELLELLINYSINYKVLGTVTSGRFKLRALSGGKYYTIERNIPEIRQAWEKGFEKNL